MARKKNDTKNPNPAKLRQQSITRVGIILITFNKLRELARGWVKNQNMIW